ncbi:MAG: hypothetical protein E3J72_19640 [Planctomycetota bacterium]|nr:MAG: hypothetical protein E3J72_19640 [Planctomycetota bacterium]
MFSISEDIVNKPDGMHIRAPRKPFPWWGPFDAVDAIGRAMLAFGLLGLSGLFLQIQYNDMFNLLLAKAAINLDTFLKLEAYLCIALMLLGVISGIGILYRKRFGLIALFAQSGLYIFIVLGVAVFFAIALIRGLFAGDPQSYYFMNRYSYYLAEFTDTGKLVFINFPVMVGSLFLALAVPGALFVCWRKACLKYEFSHVHLPKLEHGQWDGTRLFGILWLVLGTGIVLIIYQTVIYRMTYYFETERWVSYTITGIAMFLFAIGALMVTGGILFLRRSNVGRVILRSIVFAFIVLLAVVFSALVFVVPQTGLPAFEVVTLFIFITFGLFVLGYALFEVRRYFSCPKVMAWCWKGEYTPPWKRMIEQYKINKNTE